MTSTGKSYHDRAKQLYARGFDPLPIKQKAKVPTISNWQNEDRDKILETGWQKGLENHIGVGLRTGSSILGLDIDIQDIDVVREILDFISETITPHYITRTGLAPKLLIPFLCPDVTKKITSIKYLDTNGVIHLIEILAKGQQFIVYGIHPDAKKPYEWNGDLTTHSLPIFAIKQIHAIFALFDEIAKTKGWKNLSKKEQRAERVISQHKTSDKDDTPIAIYNRSASIYEVLEFYGWTHYRGEYWTRPDKKGCVSGTVFNDSILYPFTSSTCLEANKPHDAFEVLDCYGFNGDKSKCTRALRAEMQGVA